MSVRSLVKLNLGNKIHLGSLKTIFVKVSQNFIKPHLKFLPNLTDFSSQLMACMHIVIPLDPNIHFYVRRDFEKSWKMTLVLENWNSKKVQFVHELS